ncbi:GIY-YIG nuclease family protein [Clostridium sp. 19966]|uniref:GIY-YIG nuclease family protein n=1 Tax=Clostridium sp. 19966 TaxID=2768166 RepID=UPI0028DFFE70|nr:GIY-YIG nuclease family protein [Clostridium sp. 19966]MDT8719002.1 GIY-YIG nuclease family protein [Clostridium sp. 19966]
MKEKTSGIYLIEDIETGNVYVGQSKDIARRWSTHSANIKSGKHDYKELVEAYAQDSKRIKYSILEECPPDKLKEREDWWIKYIEKIDEWHIINKQRHGGASKTVRDTGNMCKAQTGESNGHCTKLNKEKVIEIKKLMAEGEYTDKHLAKMYNVSISLINSIRKGTRWASVYVD